MILGYKIKIRITSFQTYLHQKYEHEKNETIENLFKIVNVLLDENQTETQFKGLIPTLIQLSKLNNFYAVEAKFILGQCNEAGIGIQKDLKKALEFYNSCAILDHAPSQTNLGLLCLNNKFKTVLSPLQYFKLASKQNYPLAVYLMGLEILTENSNLGRSLLEKSKKLGFIPAITELGIIYIMGKGGVQKDVTRGIELFKEAMELGDADAYVMLAGYYQNGFDGVKKDVKKAIQLFSHAAKLNSELGLKFLAGIYEKGEIVQCDLKMAMELYQRAASMDYDQAQLRLAELYEHGFNAQGQTIEKDLKKSTEFYQKFLDSCNDIGESIYVKLKITEWHARGIGFEKDIPQAQKLSEQGLIEFADLPIFEKAKLRFDFAENINKLFQLIVENQFYISNQSLCILASIYDTEFDTYTPKDNNKAFILYKLAADRGYDFACFQLASCYETGKGIAINFKIAFELRLKAAFKNPIYMEGLIHYFTHFEKSMASGLRADYYRAQLILLGNLQQLSDVKLESEVKSIQEDLRGKLDKIKHKLQEAPNSIQEAIKNYHKIINTSLETQADPNFIKEMQKLVHSSDAQEYCQFTGIKVENLYSDQKLLAFKQKQAWANDLLAFCHFMGLGVKKDLDMALEYYQEAIELGSEISRVHIWFCFKVAFDVSPKYIAEAEIWLKQDSEDSNLSLLRLAELYANGSDGFTCDYTKAKICFEKLMQRDPSNKMNAVEKYEIFKTKYNKVVNEISGFYLSWPPYSSLARLAPIIAEYVAENSKGCVKILQL